MALTIHTDTPTQEIIFEPYTQKFYSYYDHVSDTVKYYIDPEFGNYTKIVGENTLLEGFEVTSPTYTASTVSCTINKGRAIIGNTYIEIESDETIIYESANVLDDSGFFALTMRFSNPHTLRSNKLTYHLTYFTADRVSFSDFDINKNLIVLDIFSFTKSGASITSFEIDDSESTVTLDGKVYTIRKNTTDTISTLIDGGIINYDESDLSTGDFVGGDTTLELFELLKTTGAITELTIT